MRRSAAIGAVLVLLATGSCGVAGLGNDPCRGGSTGATAFPGSSLEDWVTYADHAVVLRGAAEVEQDGRQEVRLVTERMLWSREQASEAAPGELFVGSSRSRQAAAGTVGRQYVAVGAWWDPGQDGSRDWTNLELLPFDDGVVGRGSKACRSTDPDSAQRLVWGDTEAELVGRLEQTPPDPLALPFMDLDPDQRWHEAAARS